MLNAQSFWDSDYSDPEPIEQSGVCFRTGFTVGGVGSWLTSREYSVPSSGFRPGIYAGAALQMRFLSRDELSNADTGVFAIQPEVRFDMSGGNFDETNKLGLNNITVPIMFRVYPTEGFFIELGPTFALNVNHSPSSLAVSSKTYDLEKLRANDFQLSAGLGYSTNNGFSVGLRYNNGISDIAQNMPWRNRSLQLGLTYTFQIKTKTFRPLD